MSQEQFVKACRYCGTLFTNLIRKFNTADLDACERCGNDPAEKVQEDDKEEDCER